MNLMAPPWYYPGTHPNPRTVRSPVRQSLRSRVEKKKPAEAIDEIGMTQERQREIQASLFKMLGQPDSAESEEGGETSQGL
jgi:hypothetical protein